MRSPPGGSPGRPILLWWAHFVKLRKEAVLGEVLPVLDLSHLLHHLGIHRNGLEVAAFTAVPERGTAGTQRKARCLSLVFSVTSPHLWQNSVNIEDKPVDRLEIRLADFCRSTSQT